MMLAVVVCCLCSSVPNMRCKHRWSHRRTRSSNPLQQRLRQRLRLRLPPHQLPLLPRGAALLYRRLQQL